MGTTPREMTPEPEMPFKDPKLHIADLPEGTRFRIVGGENQILTVADAASGRVNITPFQTATVDARAIVEVVALPNIVDEERGQADALQRHLSSSESFKAPIGLLRAAQTTHRDQLQRIIGQEGQLPVYGPDLNSLNRNDKQAQWTDIPDQSFFTKAPDNPEAGVFLKASSNHYFRACTVGEWRLGKTKNFVYRYADEKPISALGIDENSTVTVLNAPTKENVQQEIDAHLSKAPDPSVAQQQHIQGLLERAEKFHQEA